MLGFPILTAAGGWYATLLFFGLIWAIMTLSALLMVEVTLRFPQETNLSSIAKKTLGPVGAYSAWLIYVFFFYAIMTAYTSGGASILGDLLQAHLQIPWNTTQGTLLFVGFFASIVFSGTTWVDWCNRLLMLALIGAYLTLIITAIPQVNPSHLIIGQIHTLWHAVPVLITAFGFQLLIPSLKTYLHNHPSDLRTAVWLGSFLSLIVYILWEYVMLGLLPSETLTSMSARGQPVTQLTQTLDTLLPHPWIVWSMRVFGLFALLTSFIGVSLSIFDFFADAFGIEKTIPGKLCLIVLTFGIPTLFSLIYPTGFLMALGYAGTFGAILLIGFPALMAWKSRYVLHEGGYRVWGGKPLLVLAFLASVGVIFLQLGTGGS